jgi:hypothetical protein
MDTEIKSMEDLIKKINPKAKNPSKDELWKFVELSLIQLKEINDSYNKFFASPDDQVSIIADVEKKISALLDEYQKLNISLDSETQKTKLQLLNEHISAIKDYHKELLTSETSIKSDIEDSRKNITEFYNYLFAESEAWKWDDKDSKIKKAINEISDFYSKFEPSTDDIQGYRKAIEDFYNDLFLPVSGKLVSKAGQAQIDIDAIKNFRNKDLVDFEKQMKTDEKNIKSLLHGATGWSLIEGYIQSKNEYSQNPKYRVLPVIEGTLNIVEFLLNAFINSILWLVRVIVISVDYMLFIVPLLLLMMLLIQPDKIASLIWIQNINDSIKGLTFLNRILLSLPFWWISWFWQRSITQKKRLSEEYNHKAQVVKMYLNFTTNSQEYPIDKTTREKLNNELVNIIARRPWEVFGKDETIFDKLIQAIQTSRWLKVIPESRTDSGEEQSK